MALIIGVPGHDAEAGQYESGSCSVDTLYTCMGLRIFLVDGRDLAILDIVYKSVCAVGYEAFCGWEKGAMKTKRLQVWQKE